jgi:hypothetical protein
MNYVGRVTQEGATSANVSARLFSKTNYIPSAVEEMNQFLPGIWYEAVVTL